MNTGLIELIHHANPCWPKHTFSHDPFANDQNPYNTTSYRNSYYAHLNFDHKTVETPLNYDHNYPRKTQSFNHNETDDTATP